MKRPSLHVLPTAKAPPHLPAGDPAAGLVSELTTMTETLSGLAHDVRGQFVREAAEAAVGEIAHAVDRLVIQRYRWIILSLVGGIVLGTLIGGVAGYWLRIAVFPPIMCSNQPDGSYACWWYVRQPTPKKG